MPADNSCIICIPDDRKVIISRGVIFLEDMSPSAIPNVTLYFEEKGEDEICSMDERKRYKRRDRIH